MINYLCTPRHTYTINRYLSGPGRPIAGLFRVLDYAKMISIPAEEITPGAYIFTDIDRLSGHAAGRLAQLWSQMNDRSGFLLLNHPTRSMRRYELLRTMFISGVNEFDVWRLTDPRTPRRFPVFIRHENGHNGKLGNLIGDQATYTKICKRILDQGLFRDDLLVVEFCDTRSTDGSYRKYGATRINDTIVPHHIDFSSNWIVSMDASVHSDESWAIEKEYLGGCDHHAELMKIFETARIEFGRIDYSIRDGRIQVWEINTNPSYVGSAAAMPGRSAITALREERFIEAYRRLELMATNRDKQARVNH